MSLPTTYFDIFNIRPSFNIDHDSLKMKYFELSKKHHPDISADGNIEEINKAYHTLKNDFLRAKYLTGTEEMTVDRQFLMDMLDYEEAISNASQEEEKEIRKTIDEKITKCKLRFYDKHELCKWGYYERLKDLLDKRRNNL